MRALLKRRRLLLIPATLGAVALLGACQPDLFLKVQGPGPYTGKGVINTTASGQVVAQNTVEDVKAKYEIKIKNLPGTGGSCAIRLDETSFTDTGGTWTRKYLLGGVNVTTGVIGGTQSVNLAEGQSVSLIQKVTPTTTTAGNQANSFVRGTCFAASPDDIDVNKTTTTTNS